MRSYDRLSHVDRAIASLKVSIASNENTGRELRQVLKKYEAERAQLLAEVCA